MGAHAGVVSELWRFPVKGLVGERVPQVDVATRGVVGDRRYAVIGADGRIASAKTTRRFRRMPGLLTMRSWTDAAGEVLVAGEGWSGRAGSRSVDERVSDVVREPVTLRTEADVPFHDDGPVHLVTTASLRWLGERVPRARVDPRRFRPNVVVDVPGTDVVEEAWVGRELRIGSTQLRVSARAVRCVVVTLSQDDLPSAPRLLAELERRNDLCFGVYADVVASGSLAVGDAVVLA